MCSEMLCKFVVVIVFISSLCVAVREEWKNFENGEVHSSKTTNENVEAVNHEFHNNALRDEERLLHSHHNKQQNAAAEKKKSVEEEMHLRPLNERHHKFPNPAQLGGGSSSDKISKHAFLQQVRRKQMRRRGGPKKSSKSGKDTNELAAKNGKGNRKTDW